MAHEVGMNHTLNALASVVSVALFSGCQVDHALTASETLVGGEWTCVDATATGSNRLVFQSDGTWRNTLETGGAMPNGEEMRVQLTSHGTYRVEDDKLWTRGKAIDSVTVTRNGVSEPIAPETKAQMEQDGLQKPDVPASFQLVDENHFILSGSSMVGGNLEQTCTR